MSELNDLSGSPLISVIVPTYERKDYLKRAILSIGAQTYRPLELVVILDGQPTSPSNQVTADELKKWVGEGVSIIILQNESPSGGARARNQGISNAHGSFVAFLDDDDAWLPGKIQEQLNAFQLNQSLSVVSCDYQVLKNETFSGEVTLSENNGPNIKQSLLLSNVLGSCSLCMVKKSELDAIQGFDEELLSCQDWDLWLRLANGFGGIYVVPQTLTLYREHAMPRISNDTWKRVSGYSRMVVKHRQEYPPTVLAFHTLRIVQTGLKRVPTLYKASRTLGRCIRYGLALFTGYQYKNGETKDGKAK